MKLVFFLSPLLDFLNTFDFLLHLEFHLGLRMFYTVLSSQSSSYPVFAWEITVEPSALDSGLLTGTLLTPLSSLDVYCCSTAFPPPCFQSEVLISYFFLYDFIFVCFVVPHIEPRHYTYFSSARLSCDLKIIFTF